MRIVTPEILWNERDPIQSIDFQFNTSRLATGSTNSSIRIWNIEIEDDIPVINFRANLDRHEKAVNVVRFSKNGDFLASGSDDSIIIIWKFKGNTVFDLENDQNDNFKDDSDIFNEEDWIVEKHLRGHLSDVIDLSWGLQDSSALVSGSIDGSVILWDVTTGTSLKVFDEHSGLIKGICFDPLGEYICSLCTDRCCLVYDTKKKEVKAKFEYLHREVAYSHKLMLQKRLDRRGRDIESDAEAWEDEEEQEEDEEEETTEPIVIDGPVEDVEPIEVMVLSDGENDADCEPGTSDEDDNIESSDDDDADINSSEDADVNSTDNDDDVNSTDDDDDADVNSTDDDDDEEDEDIKSSDDEEDEDIKSSNDEEVIGITSSEDDEDEADMKSSEVDDEADIKSSEVDDEDDIKSSEVEDEADIKSSEVDDDADIKSSEVEDEDVDVKSIEDNDVIDINSSEDDEDDVIELKENDKDDDGESSICSIYSDNTSNDVQTISDLTENAPITDENRVSATSDKNISQLDGTDDIEMIASKNGNESFITESSSSSSSSSPIQFNRGASYGNSFMTMALPDETGSSDASFEAASISSNSTTSEVTTCSDSDESDKEAQLRRDLRQEEAFLHIMQQKFIANENMNSFFRRLTFSIDGKMLLIPACKLNYNLKEGTKINTTMIFSRNNLESPVAHLPTAEPSLCIKFSPIVYKLRAEYTDKHKRKYEESLNKSKLVLEDIIRIRAELKSLRRIRPSPYSDRRMPASVAEKIKQRSDGESDTNTDDSDMSNNEKSNNDLSMPDSDLSSNEEDVQADIVLEQLRADLIEMEKIPDAVVEDTDATSDTDDDEEMNEKKKGRHLKDTDDDEEMNEKKKGRHLKDTDDDEEMNEKKKGRHLKDTDDDEEMNEKKKGRHLKDTEDDEEMVEKGHHLNDICDDDQSEYLNSSINKETVVKIEPDDEGTKKRPLETSAGTENDENRLDTSDVPPYEVIDIDSDESSNSSISETGDRVPNSGSESDFSLGSYREINSSEEDEGEDDGSDDEEDEDDDGSDDKEDNDKTEQKVAEQEADETPVSKLETNRVEPDDEEDGEKKEEEGKEEGVVEDDEETSDEEEEINLYDINVEEDEKMYEEMGIDSYCKLPYRMIFAIITYKSVYLYDTQQPQPFFRATNLHYSNLTDATWSSDGHKLMVSSRDGYVSLIQFDEDELGDTYERDINEMIKPVYKVNTVAELRDAEVEEDGTIKSDVKQKLNTSYSESPKRKSELKSSQNSPHSGQIINLNESKTPSITNDETEVITPNAKLNINEDAKQSPRRVTLTTLTSDKKPLRRVMLTSITKLPQSVSPKTKPEDKDLKDNMISQNSSSPKTTKLNTTPLKPRRIQLTTVPTPPRRVQLTTITNNKPKSPTKDS